MKDGIGAVFNDFGSQECFSRSHLPRVQRTNGSRGTNVAVFQFHIWFMFFANTHAKQSALTTKTKNWRKNSETRIKKRTQCPPHPTPSPLRTQELIDPIDHFTLEKARSPHPLLQAKKNHRDKWTPITSTKNLQHGLPGSTDCQDGRRPRNGQFGHKKRWEVCNWIGQKGHSTKRTLRMVRT